MKIQNISEVRQVLGQCRAVHIRDAAPTGFYTLKAHEVRFPDGHLETREYVDKNPAAIVLPITATGDIIFVVQPIGNVPEGSLLELPAGYSKDGEPIQTTAVRELLEETGYQPENIESLGYHYQDPGLISQSVDEFIAIGCQKVTKQKLDKGEFIKYLEIPPSLIPKLTKAGLILDSNTINTLYNAIVLGRLKLRNANFDSTNEDVTIKMLNILSNTAITPAFAQLLPRATSEPIDFDSAMYAEKFFIQHYQKGLAKIFSVRKGEFDNHLSEKTLDCLNITVVIEGPYPSITTLEFLYFPAHGADDEPALVIQNSGHIIYQRERRQDPRSEWLINSLSEQFKKTSKQ